MEIKKVTYEIIPFDKFEEIFIWKEKERFYIGVSYIGNGGKESFFIFKNLIVGAVGFMANKDKIQNIALYFGSIEDCFDYLQDLTVSKFKLEFKKGELEEKFLIAQRF